MRDEVGQRQWSRRHCGSELGRWASDSTCAQACGSLAIACLLRITFDQNASNAVVSFGLRS